MEKFVGLQRLFEGAGLPVEKFKLSKFKIGEVLYCISFIYSRNGTIRWRPLKTDMKKTKNPSTYLKVNQFLSAALARYFKLWNLFFLQTYHLPFTD